ncbi:FMP27 [[Candida] subhashii]|uniref:FMP27 n=1 Tax=[Candida] subhashii TaxID=561895 RepID=A0A8J5QGZ9_9ASCO|nr:FMP27 [[Candida] subhashii]KAG7660863.1 FMP27 [[Candida] subhashii]
MPIISIGRQKNNYKVIIRSLRFKLWGNNRMIIIDDLEIKRYSKTTKTPSKRKQQHHPDTANSNSFVNIFPVKRIPRTIVSILIRHIPSIDIEFRHVLFLSTNDHSTRIEYMRFNLESRYSKRFNDEVKYKMSVSINDLLHETNTNNGIIIQPFSLAGFRVEFKFSVNFYSGVMDKLTSKMNISESDISIFNAMKYYIFAECDEEKERVEATITKPNEEFKGEATRSVPPIERYYRTVYSLVSDITVHLENCKISEIPIATIDHNIDMKEYFSATKPQTYLEVTTKSVSFNFARLYKEAAGFEVLFDPEKDKPFHLTCSVQLLKVSFAQMIQRENGTNSKSMDEILNIPNFALTYKTNVLDQLVKAKGFKNCIIEVYFSASTPILDMNTRQLSAVLYNIVLIQKYSKLKRIRRALADWAIEKEQQHVESDDGIDEDTPQELDISFRQMTAKHESLKARIWRHVNEIYPHLDMKVVIEQPRLVLRHYEQSKNTQILTFSYSLFNFSLSTTESRDYQSSCQILYPKLIYQEKSCISSHEDNNEIIRKQVSGLSYFDLKFNLYKNLKLRCSMDLSDLAFDLTNIDIFNGINSLLLDITKIAETDLQIGVINVAFNEELARLRTRLLNRNDIYDADFSPAIKKSLEDSLFRYLPRWLIDMEFKLSRLNILLGSRSVLIPKEQLSRMKGEDFTSDFNHEHELRASNLKIETLDIKLVNNRIHRNDYVSIETAPFISSSSETLASLEDDISYWTMTSNIEQLAVETRSNLELKLSSSSSFENLLTIPSFKATVSAICDSNLENKLVVDFDCGKIKFEYDKYKIFTLIGSIYLIDEYIVGPLQFVRKKMKREMVKFNNPLFSPREQESKRTILDYLIMDMKLEGIDMLLHLGSDFNSKFEFMKVMANINEKQFSLSVGLSRLLADSPTVVKMWCRILCLDNLAVSFRLPHLLRDLKIDITTEAIRLFQPHDFVVYKLFDHISVAWKLNKHLFKQLKNQDPTKSDSKVVHPKLQNAVRLPLIKVRSKYLKFMMEDDPFEAELGMIYQLGRVEQRKRMELYSLFETKADEEDYNGDAYFDKLHRLNTTISSSWIRKVKVYKAKLKDEIIDNRKYLFGCEAGNVDERLNEDVVPYSCNAPLFSIYMENVDLDLAAPKFDLHDLPNFIHAVGQGVPKSTLYSLLIPMYLNLELSELRMHLRDYPIPLLHAPRNKDKSNPSVKLRGHLIITDQLLSAMENIRKINVQLTPQLTKHNQVSHKFDSIIIEKVLSSVKLYTDLACHFDSDYPTRFIWCTSYNFAIQQLMLNFDQFSKPPIDPSRKLGFWDKIKLILHGKCVIKTRQSLEIGFKGSRDPYDLFNIATGFVLSFRKNVVWTINKDDDPTSLFDINSDKVSWYIPNYLGAPLLSWTRKSSKSVYMPDSPNFISSCFAYYLEPTNNVKKVDLDYARRVFAKDVINLSGGVHFRLGFLFQRKDKSGERTDQFKPHYEVSLYHPDYCEPGHDSYEGFRSEYIHMSYSLDASSEQSYNTIHLTPGVFTQYFSWWDLFSSNMLIPVRRGPMFGETKQSIKFSSHLCTNKFSFYLKSLFISHVYRDEIIDYNDDKVECIGIRAKMDLFSVDLHQRKEPRIVFHEGLSKNENITRMNFNVGEVHLCEFDLRVMNATFIQNLLSQQQNEYDDSKSKYDIFDNDKHWFDINDYEEACLPSIKNCDRTVKVIPLMYCRRFSYERDTHSSSNTRLLNHYDQFGDEVIHECRLGKLDPFQPQVEVLRYRVGVLSKQLKRNQKKGKDSRELMERIKYLNSEIKDLNDEWHGTCRRQSTLSQLDRLERYNNKFTLFSMLLKWNFNCRNLALKYIHFVQLKASVRKFASHESISMLEKIIDKSNQILEMESASLASDAISRLAKAGRSSDQSRKKESTSKERLENFDNILREKRTTEDISEDYLIELISPQIQLESTDCPDSVVLISAPSIDSKIVSIIDKYTTSEVLEERIGVLFRDASIFVLNKTDVLNADNIITSETCYGAKGKWPPWLGSEITKNAKWAGANQLLVEQLSVSLFYTEVQILGNRLAQINDVTSHLSVLDQGNTIDAHEDIEAPKKLRIDAPSVIVSSTASQYFTLYVIILSLLFYNEPMSKVIAKKLEKLHFSIDFSDLTSMSEKLIQLQDYYKMLNLLSHNFSFRQGELNNEGLNDYLSLNAQRREVASDIYLLLRTLLTGEYANDSSKALQRYWLVRADEVILHILEDDRTPIIDLALARGTYKRKELEDGSNINKLEIGIVQGFNLIPKARYPDFISPFKFEESLGSLIEVEWTMRRSVGGIKVIQNIEINSLPLNIKLDETTGEKLMNFIFGSKESPILEITHDSRSKALQEDKDVAEGEDDDIFGFVHQNKDSDKSVTIDSKGSKKNSGLGSASQSTDTGSGTTNGDQIRNDQIDTMIERSKKFFSVVSLLVRATSLQISLKLNKGYKRILNVQDLQLDLREIRIQHQILSFLEMSKLIQKEIVKTLLNHTGKLLSNKLSVTKRSSKEILALQIKPLKKYARFTKISELLDSGNESQ